MSGRPADDEETHVQVQLSGRPTEKSLLLGSEIEDDHVAHDQSVSQDCAPSVVKDQRITWITRLNYVEVDLGG